MSFFDIASLTKCLVTAPLALIHLGLDKDRRAQLGFRGRPEILTVRQLLSHSAGLPSWLPFTGERLADQLKRGYPAGEHPLIKEGAVGTSLYSDLGFRLLADLLEKETGRNWQELGQELTGLMPAPWNETPVCMPDGPDIEAWHIAEPYFPAPERACGLPHDANARNGMKGHAGFGANPEQLKDWLTRWMQLGFPGRMSVNEACTEEGRIWGLGLQAVSDDFAVILSQLPTGFNGVHLIESDTKELPILKNNGLSPKSCNFWMHTGFTGPAIFVNHEEGLCIVLLLHRLGPDGQLLDAATLHQRRLSLMEGWISGQCN